MGRDLFDIALMKKFGGGSGGGVSSWNDLTDKPFGEMMGEVVLAEGEYTSEYDSTYGSFSAYGEWSKEQLEVPSTFTLVFDGETYEISEIVNIPSLGDMFGNLYFLNAIAGTSFPNTGEPFLGWLSTLGFNLFLMDTTPTAHSVKFTAIQEVVIPIPENYVPYALPYCIRVISEGDNWTCDATIRELEEAWNSGRQIILKAGEESGDLGMLVVYYLHGRYRTSYTDENAYGAVYLFYSFVDSFAPYSLIPKADGTYEVRTGT